MFDIEIEEYRQLSKDCTLAYRVRVALQRLADELRDWKEICARRDAAVKLYGDEWVKAKTETDTVKAELAIVKSELAKARADLAFAIRASAPYEGY